MGIGTRIKEIAKKQGITLAQLSEMTGISVNTFYSMTSRDSNNIRPKNLKKIAEALNISESELLNDNSSTVSITNETFNSFEDLLKSVVRVVHPNIDQRKLDIPEEFLDFLLSEKIKEDLLAYYDQLNLEGQNIAKDKVRELTEIPKYQRESENSAKKELPPAANRKQPEDE